MRKEFKIMYLSRYEADPSLAGKQYKSSGMIAMNIEGVFLKSFPMDTARMFGSYQRCCRNTMFVGKTERAYENNHCR